MIIEYKKVASSELINQSLYYLHWIRDHKGDFQVAVNSAIGNKIEVDWSDIRVICLAPEYKKFDLHAVQVMGANIELWQFKIYENGILSIEEVYKRTSTKPQSNSEEPSEKNPVIVEAGKKAALTRKTGTYTVEEHIEDIDLHMRELFNTIRDYIISLDSSIDEVPKKNYIAYKTSQNFVCLQPYKIKFILYLKLNADEIIPMPKQGRDGRNIGHFGTGDFELTLRDLKDFEETKQLINRSYKSIGG